MGSDSCCCVDFDNEFVATSILIVIFATVMNLGVVDVLMSILAVIDVAVSTIKTVLLFGAKPHFIFTVFAAYHRESEESIVTSTESVIT